VARRTAASPTACGLGIFASLVVLSGLSCIIGTFYDDEIYNIKTAALPYLKIIEYINGADTVDVHPPSSYILNKLTFVALGSWKAVKFLNGTLNAAAVAWFYYCMAEKVSCRERFALFFFLATAVTVEMWGTSLRWYAYFNPTFFVLYAIAFSQRLSVISRAAILAAGTVMLFYTSYLTWVAAPILWGTFVATSIKMLKRETIVHIVWILFASLILVLPQLYVFAEIHLPGSISQTGPILYSTAQSLSTLLLGNTIFPLDYVPVLFLALLTAAAISVATKVFRDEFFALTLGGVILGLILLVTIGIGVKARNAVFLYPAALMLIIISISRSHRAIRLPAMAVMVLVHLIAVYDFIFHCDTVKGSYNTPFSTAMREIGKVTRECPGKAYNFTHDPVMAYLIEEAGGRVSSPYAKTGTAETIFVKEMDCVLVIHTYRGRIPPQVFAQYNNSLELKNFTKVRTIQLGYDRFYMIKARIAKEPFPEYYIAIDVYDARNDASLLDWYDLRFPS
jgi:hypothetical protein